MKYFTIGELSQSNEADKRGIPNHPNTAQKMNMEKLIDRVLDPIRELYGKPIYVNSGFRCLTLNKVIGGAKNSQHCDGKAADVTGGSKEENKKIWDIVMFLYQEGDIEFDQCIDESGLSWIHISYNEDNNRCQVLKL